MKEILRLLGVPEGKADDKIISLISAVTDELRNKSTPMSIIKEIPGIDSFDSKKLNAHLKGCKRFFLMAATLGAPADAVIRKYSKTDVARGAVAQAAGSYLIEEYCDKIMNETDTDGLFFKPRFSPGYGDFDLSYQKIILDTLDAGKRIGITLTESYMMIPTKSVTAVLGLTDEPSCNIGKCMLCQKKDCEFRKES